MGYYSPSIDRDIPAQLTAPVDWLEYVRKLWVVPDLRNLIPNRHVYRNASVGHGFLSVIGGVVELTDVVTELHVS